MQSSLHQAVRKSLLYCQGNVTQKAEAVNDAPQPLGGQRLAGLSAMLAKTIKEKFSHITKAGYNGNTHRFDHHDPAPGVVAAPVRRRREARPGAT